MSVFELFHSLQYSPLLVAMRASPWIFAVIASVHLMGLAVVGGAVLALDLRLLGLGLTRQPASYVARETERWLLAGLVVMVLTGLLQFMCFAATKYYYLTSFWVKIAVLPLALLFTFTVRRRVALADAARVRPLWNRVVAIASLGLWLTVGIAGRLIGLP
ncbi:MAG: hypothetical protein A3F70_05185 [Acidobacteria bacterium RIFCSPLOWO2_12_FULL_67_14]|nr:MAG: hypothetical protein A3H29_02395 [Acidobacteria bacterium RIFCSPLOWO2_02_FULL_67_21]OFW37840.1 MAG: hypothetical protein A3F70_05185 [Acidobacteria bacterium RIFCSPLOWO2_12_FULL_67_14]